jgi:hypothetical protein
MKRTIFICVLFSVLSRTESFSADSTNAVLTYVDLAKRLTDLDHLATLPQPGEKTAQWSSYDRASKYDEKTGKYVRWDANGDGNGVIRNEGGKLVLAEMNGPGCIWRIWSATPKQGHVRIYLDGANEPTVDLPFTGYFDGKNAPFTRAALVHTTAANGWNNYTPIPFQKSCKIVADKNWGDYYQFTYTTFPKGTEVPTFKRELSAQENTALDEADKILSTCGPRKFPNGQASTSGDGLLGGNGSHESDKLNGPGAINCIRVKFDPPLTPADRDVLRSRFAGTTNARRRSGHRSEIFSAPLPARMFIARCPAAIPRTAGFTRIGSCHSQPTLR